MIEDKKLVELTKLTEEMYQRLDKIDLILKSEITASTGFSKDGGKGK